MNKKFGSFLRELRIKKGLGQRELANNMGFHHPINDIEKEKRGAQS